MDSAAFVGIRLIKNPLLPPGTIRNDLPGTPRGCAMHNLSDEQIKKLLPQQGGEDSHET